MNELCETALGGKAGSDFSSFSLAFACAAAAFDFFRLRAMSDSWQLIQKMPCDVRAYRKFSIFLLQLRHRKHVAQKAWSPVRMANSSILLPQALQLYVQLLQTSEPSPRSKRFASESSSVLHWLHLKQSRCHLRSAVNTLALPYLPKYRCPYRYMCGRV